MNKLFLSLLALLFFVAGCKTSRNTTSQNNIPITELPEIEVIGSRQNLYRASETKINNLIHADLKVRFDWEKQYLYGSAELTLQPHFYPTQELILDAKNFDIHKLALIDGNTTQDLQYTYDTSQLKINLGKEFPAGKPYKILIDYTAKPNERKLGGSAAIAGDKGLYFINPLNKEKNKPRQIWTQGETEANSAWFPCIDKPNQKMTQQLAITTEAENTTLSNGLLIKSISNTDGTRTDIWKMDLPHAPYLVMMAIGKYAVVKDRWRDKEVSYYVEPEYASVAKDIFGVTPEMLELFSTKLGVDYPWQKYAQIIARDYVSGAMENTSATLHGEFVQRNARQLYDEKHEDIIAHELFHQWFGDLVTCESWSNIPLNESFATYGEYLWNEHKHGTFYADWKQLRETEGYHRESKRKNVHLIRFYYHDKEDMFDAHSYNKGGAILNMLRAEVGDDAFFKSLQLYLKTNAFKTVEVHNLRLAFEEVTGRDMNRFFNQWFLNNGHPILNIKYSHTADSVFVDFTQKQNTDRGTVYELPMKINVHYGNIVMTYPIVFNRSKQRFAFKALGTPDLIDADADRVLLCKKTENKTVTQYAFQFAHSEKYVVQKEALEALKDSVKTNTDAELIFHKALRSPHFEIKKDALKYIGTDSVTQKLFLNDIIALVEDSSNLVRSDALYFLGKTKDKNYLPFYEKALKDSSYNCVANALESIEYIDTILSTAQAKILLSEPDWGVKNECYDILSKRYDRSLDQLFQEKLTVEQGHLKTALFYYYANYLTHGDSAQIVNGLKNIAALASDDESKKNIFTGKSCIERVKGYVNKRSDAPFKKDIAALADELIGKLKEAE